MPVGCTIVVHPLSLKRLTREIPGERLHWECLSGEAFRKCQWKAFLLQIHEKRRTGWFDEIQRTAKVPVSKCNAWCSRRRPSVVAHPVLALSHWCWRQLPEVQQPACSKQSVACPHHCCGESRDMHHNCCKSSHSPPNLAVTPVKEVSQQFWNEFSMCSVGVFWFKMQSACQVQWNLSLKAP